MTIAFLSTWNLGSLSHRSDFFYIRLNQGLYSWIFSSQKFQRVAKSFQIAKNVQKFLTILVTFWRKKIQKLALNRTPSETINIVFQQKTFIIAGNDSLSIKAMKFTELKKHLFHSNRTYILHNKMCNVMMNSDKSLPLFIWWWYHYNVITALLCLDF